MTGLSFEYARLVKVVATPVVINFAISGGESGKAATLIKTKNEKSAPAYAWNP